MDIIKLKIAKTFEKIKRISKYFVIIFFICLFNHCITSTAGEESEKVKKAAFNGVVIDRYTDTVGGRPIRYALIENFNRSRYRLWLIYGNHLNFFSLGDTIIKDTSSLKIYNLTKKNYDGILNN